MMWALTSCCRAGRLAARAAALCAVILMALASPPLPAAERKADQANAVPHLGERGRKEYRNFLAADNHRAFVIAPGGAWAWRAGASSPEAALAAAREDCLEHSEQTCVAYALDDRVVFDEKTWVGLWGPYKTAAEAAQAAEGTRRGERFPDLALTDPNGRPFRVSGLRGKIAVLHFWGSWCPPCVHELPQFVRLRRKLADTPDVAFVFSQMREAPQTARRWLERHKLDLPLYDSGARSASDDRLHLGDGRQITDRVLAPGFPTTYVLDRHGLVLFSLRGPASDWSQYAPFLRHAAANSAK